MEVSGQLQVLAPLYPRYLLYRSWVGPRAGLNAVTKRIPNSERPARWLVTVTNELPQFIPIKWVRGDISAGIKRSERKDDHSPTSGAEVKNA
jgi:hypothetical protein